MSKRSVVSSSLTRKVSSATFRDVARLGERLVRKLGDDHRDDLLTLWMSRYIAELLGAAERAIPAERDAATARCASAILDLWAHRSDLPQGARPFEGFEGVAMTLRALQQDGAPFYSRQIRWLADAAVTHEKAAALLAMVRVVDTAARTAMQFFINDASALLREDADEWLADAQSPAVPRSTDVDAIAEILIHITGEHESEARRRGLLQQIDNLKGLQSALQAAEDRLSGELASLPAVTS